MNFYKTYLIILKMIDAHDRDDLIAENFYEFMPPIKRGKSRMSYYDKDELKEIFNYTDDSLLKIIVRITAYYEFRQSYISPLPAIKRSESK